MTLYRQNSNLKLEKKHKRATEQNWKEAELITL